MYKVYLIRSIPMLITCFNPGTTNALSYIAHRSDNHDISEDCVYIVHIN